MQQRRLTYSPPTSPPPSPPRPLLRITISLPCDNKLPSRKRTSVPTTLSLFPWLSSFPPPHASLICTTSRVFMDESSSADAPISSIISTTLRIIRPRYLPSSTTCRAFFVHDIYHPSTTLRIFVDDSSIWTFSSSHFFLPPFLPYNELSGII